MAKLVDVYRPSKTLSRRQLPLVVDETLTMVMDLKSLGLVSDSQQVKGKELEDFSRKMGLLSNNELNEALKVNRSEIIHVLNQSVPCVGCRRSVERLYYQLCKFEYPTFDPLMITSEGIVTIREDKHGSPQFVCSLFHGHSARLNNLVDSQPRRNKKSHRCLLHSLDSQRSRPITPVWRDVWDCMRLECRRDVCIIEGSSLRVTLETYLRKHRFCGECRTKVQKAYSLLIEDPEPRKEKGYVTALYAGIKRCIQEKHIHLPTKTEFIAKLIGRAEPELLGRRERHAKTLEIAQEEVLTCIGICMYERLHRIYMRMREEECTCQVFAAVAVDALCRSFETAVESKQGISQLELLYAELTREEQQKQIRKEAKKLKRKRKKGKSAEQNGKENCHEYDGAEFDEKDEIEKECRCKLDKTEPLNCLNCEELSLNKQSSKCNGTKTGNNKKSLGTTPTAMEGGGVCDGGGGGEGDAWLSPCKMHDVKKKEDVYKCDNGIIPGGGAVVGVEYNHKKDGCRDHSHDCGYSSENNNGCCETESLTSSIPSSPDGSEIACSDGCCQQENDVEETEFGALGRFTYGTNSHQLSLEQMLEDHCYADDNDCYITPEEVREFKSNNRQVYEVRQQLRETLRTRFAQLCANGPLQVPRFLVQSKYASN